MTVEELYRSLGCHVHPTEQFRTGRIRNMSRGLPDLWVMHPRLGGWWHEKKKPHEAQLASQKAFEQQCIVCGVAYVLGGVREAVGYLVGRGLLEPGSLDAGGPEASPY